MSDPSPSMPPALSPGKQLALEGAAMLIGVVGVGLSCLCLLWLWRATIGSDGGGGGGTRTRRRERSSSTPPDPHATPPVHEEQRQLARIVVVGTIEKPPFIIPGRGEA